MVNPLEGFGLVARVREAGGRLALTDRGLALLARRDRTSLAVAKKRWSVAPEDAQADYDWRNVSGRNSRQLLRNLDHTAAVHAFLAATDRPGPAAGVGGVATGPAETGLPLLPPPGPDALGQPRRLRRPAPK